MSTATDTPAPAATPINPVQALAIENAALALRLRGAQIPQHVGMAAAARALATDLPRVLAAQLEADLKSGAFAKRWAEAQELAAESPAGVDVEPGLAAVTTLLIDQAKVAARYLSVRGEEWASDAYRLEGQAGTLEAQSERLIRASAPEASAAAGS